MIKADTPQLERIAQRLALMASNSEDICSLLRRIDAELESDLELAAYPQAAVVCEAVQSAIAALSKADELLQGLKTVLAFAPAEYEDAEKQQIDAISRLTALLSGINMNLVAAETPGKIVVEEQGSYTERDALVACLVADSAAELQITNLAVLSKAVEEEYGSFTVVDWNGETEVKQ